MKTDDLDDALRHALAEEDAELLLRLEREHDPGIADVVRAGFRGRAAWWVWLTSGVQVVVFAVAVWTAVRFFGAATVDDRLYWGVLMLLAAGAVALIKAMVWNHLENASLRRELKRVELRTAALMLQRHDVAAD